MILLLVNLYRAITTIEKILFCQILIHRGHANAKKMTTIETMLFCQIQIHRGHANAKKVMTIEKALFSCTISNPTEIPRRWRTPVWNDVGSVWAPCPLRPLCETNDNPTARLNTAMQRTGVQYFEGLAPAKRLPLRDLHAFVVKGLHQLGEPGSVKLRLVTAQGRFFL